MFARDHAWIAWIAVLVAVVIFASLSSVVFNEHTQHLKFKEAAINAQVEAQKAIERASTAEATAAMWEKAAANLREELRQLKESKDEIEAKGNERRNSVRRDPDDGNERRRLCAELKAAGYAVQCEH